MPLRRQTKKCTTKSFSCDKRNSLLTLNANYRKRTFRRRLTVSFLQSMGTNLESFICLWLDRSVSMTDDNVNTQQQLRKIINHLQTFDNANECEKYIRRVANEKIVLIVSGTLGREVVPRVHDLSQLSACYVFCKDKKGNEKWAREYTKVTFFVLIHKTLSN